jgi:hypothetical protein
MLKIGDYVAFHWKDGVLEGQGILDSFVGMSSPCDRYADAVFQIGVRNRVAASTDFAKFTQGTQQARALLITAQLTQHSRPRAPRDCSGEE